MYLYMYLYILAQVVEASWHQGYTETSVKPGSDDCTTKRIFGDHHKEQIMLGKQNIRKQDVITLEF
jgi:hypothetical protein